MASLLSGITFKAVSKNSEKLAKNESKNPEKGAKNESKKVPSEGVKVNNRTQRETRQSSNNLDKSVKEEKKLPNENDERPLNIKRVTKQLFVDKKEETGDEHNLEKQTKKHSDIETKKSGSKELPSAQQQINKKRGGNYRPCVVCDEMVEVGKVMEKHLAAKHSEELKSIPMSNDMGECVRTKCVICDNDKTFVIQRMRAHVKAAHGITMIDYRRDHLAGKTG